MRSRSSESNGPMTPPPRQLDGGWTEFKHLILESLQRLQGDINGIREKDLTDLRQCIDEVKDDMRDRLDTLRREDLDAMKMDIVMLKVKAGMWGAMAGLIGGAIISALIAKLIH